MSAKNFETDVLIIGSGIGGLLTALLIDRSIRVTVVTKSTLSKTATELAQGGIAAVSNFKKDSFAQHQGDTLQVGHGLNKRAIVKEVTEKGPEIISLLSKLGVPFEKTLHLEGGHSYPRVNHVKDMTGKKIEEALITEVKRRKNIAIYEHTLAIDLIHKNNICQGAIFLKKNTVISIVAKIVVLATGGIGQAYRYTTNPAISTGDGIAMSSRADVTIEDMEFVQFHPTALLENKTPQLLLSEALRGAGAHIINEHGERFIQKYDSRGELSPRDTMTKAIFEELCKGKVYLEFKGKKNIQKDFPVIWAAVWHKKGLDLGKDRIPITPVAHYLCGGIKTDGEGLTSMKNLYAMGECASTGLHGANRLASNSLLEAAVFATKVAAKTTNYVQKNYTKNKAKKHQKITIPQLTPAPQTYHLKTLRKKIQTIMWDYVGILRTKDRLNRARDELMRIYPLLPPSHLVNKEIIETRNLLEVGLLITKAALSRKKSIGCHWRQDT